MSQMFKNYPSMTYEALPPSIPATVNVVSFPAISDSYTSNANNVIKIDVKADALLSDNNFVKFNLTNNSTVAVNLDGYASAIIKKLRIMGQNSVELFNCDNYHRIYNNVLQTNGSASFQRIMSIVGGGDDTTDNDLLGGGGNLIPATGTKTYCLPLMCGVLSSGKLFPLNLVNLTIEIYLEPDFATVFNSAVVFAGTQTYTVSQVSYQASLINITDDRVKQTIMQQYMTKGLQISTERWECFSNPVTANNVNHLQITARNDYVSAIVTLLISNTQPSRNTSGIQSYNHGCTQSQIKFGNAYYPVQAIDSTPQMYLESLKCYNTSIFSLKTDTFAQIDTFGTTDLTKFGSFSLSTDLEPFSVNSESGVNASQGLPIYQILKTSTACQAYSFVRSKVIYDLKQGQIYASN